MGGRGDPTTARGNTSRTNNLSPTNYKVLTMSNPSLDTFKRHRDGDYVLVFSSRKYRALKPIN
jgi:hypothetical protein